MLSIENLSKTFDKMKVFEDFSIKIENNSFHVLTGPSGCGKTTFFNILMGNTSKDKGTIFWQGEKIDHLGSIAAFMQQKDLLLPWLSLFENAMLPVRFGSSGYSTQRVKCRELFNFMGIGGFETFFPSRVSGGMKKRCALARTLMFNRDVILLDEPLSSLDTLRRYDMYSLLLSLQQKFGKTILMITHDIDEALLLADRLTLVTNMPMKRKQTFSSFPQKPRIFSDSKLTRLKEEVLANLEGTSAI